MKKVLYLVLVISSIAHAGFFGSMVGGAIGASAGSSSPQQPTVVQTRLKKINSYLWDMHESGIYSKDYKFYLKHLEKSDAIGDLDTVAWVYKDNGNKKKAIEIYKTRIIPWIKIENSQVQSKYKRYYKIISGEIKTMKKVDGVSKKQQCLQSGGNWNWNGSISEWSCD